MDMSMTGQGTLFFPGQGNIQTPTVWAHLLARRGDPVTSKRAARRVARSHQLGSSLDLFLGLLDQHGDLTCREAGDRMLCKPDYWRVEFDKRVKGWELAGHITTRHNEAGFPLEIRGGGIVWRLK